VIRRLQELAFFFAESGRLAEAAKLVSQAGGKAPPAARPSLLKAIRALDTLYYPQIQERYYPVMVPVAGGTFLMGDGDEAEEHMPVEQTVKDFHLARTETTVWQYYLFAIATGRRLQVPAWGLWGDYPVVNVAWYEALEYAYWLSKQKGLTSPLRGPLSGDSITVDWQAGGFRLPTEAEWEYAARGGRAGAKKNYFYAGGNELSELAWYGDNAQERAQPVGRLKANALGLYDLSGNVWEWCWDNASPLSDPDKRRVVRGGSWDCQAVSCRVTARYGSYPDGGDQDYGFRVARR
jgi:formylglycine-generating enzyme required for sulfatase activity